MTRDDRMSPMKISAIIYVALTKYVTMCYPLGRMLLG